MTNTPLRMYRRAETRRPEPNIKVADTDATKVPVNYVTVKRPAKSIGATADSDYARDDVLQSALIAYCQRNGYPLSPGGDGKFPRTTRVPVYLLRNTLEETFEARRGVHVGPGYFCTCSEWRLKTPEEATKDKLPYIQSDVELYMDDEQYFIGEARRQKWTTSGDGKERRTKPDGGPFGVVCNPHTCPFPNHADPKKRCKLSATILLKARGWATDAFRVETTSWETCARFPASFDLVFEALSEFLVGAPLDLVLQFSRPKTTPDGSKRPRPFWTLELPFGMSEEDVRAETLSRAKAIIADRREALALRQEYEAVSLMARSPQALMAHEDDDVLALPPVPEEAATFTTMQRDAIAILMQQYKKGQPEAEALVRSNAADLNAMWARLGDPQAQAAEAPDVALMETGLADDADAESRDHFGGAEDEDAAVAGAVEPEDEAPTAPPEEEVIDVEPEPMPEEDAQIGMDMASPEGDRTVELTMDGDEVVDVREVPAEEQQPAPPEATTPPMFPSTPANCFQVAARFNALGEGADFERLLSATWKKITGVAKTLVPSPATCSDPDQQDALFAELLRRSELWWAKTGYAKHGQ